jgi:hypothetical protein
MAVNKRRGMLSRFVNRAIKVFKNVKPKHLSIFLIAFSYLFFTVYYMGPSVWHCNDTLYGFGDNTAGPVWRFSLEPKQSILGNYETTTNFPVGENLYSPVNYSLSGQSAAIWALSRTTSPICGYNLFNMAGFVLSALVMFAFIYTLFGNMWIAWLAGFAVSFTPYYQVKVGGHPGYGFQAILIAIAWAFFNLLKKQRKRDALCLGLLVAFCFYFDPYFSLLAGSTIGPLLGVWALISWWRIRKKIISKKVITRQFKLLLPLFSIIASHGKEISKSVAAYRGNILYEATACSNLPHEYVLPFARHTIGRLSGHEEQYTRLITRLHNGLTCCIGEDTVGVSIMVLTVVGTGLLIFAWERLNKRKLKFSTEYDSRLLLLGFSAVGLFAVLLALPPLKLAGIPTPSFVLLSITTTWRTLTRLYVVVNIAAVVLFSVFLVLASNQFKKYKGFLRAGFIILFLGIFIEYQAFPPFYGNGLSSFSYKNNVPVAYRWLKDQPDIHAVAEYPLERSGSESNAMAYYLSMQLYHKKKLFNGNVPTTYEDSLRDSLKDIADPQTQNVLYSIGVDAVILHGITEQDVRSIPGIEVLYSAPPEAVSIHAYTPLVKEDFTVIVRLTKRNPITTMLAFESGFVRNATIIHSVADWQYEALNKSRLKVVNLPGRKSDPETTLSVRCFSVRMAGDKDTAELSVMADGKEVTKTRLTYQLQRIRVSAFDYIELSNSGGFNMRVQDLGCAGDEL